MDRVPGGVPGYRLATWANPWGSRPEDATGVNCRGEFLRATIWGALISASGCRSSAAATWHLTGLHGPGRLGSE